MNCPKCHTEIGEGNIFCGKCGRKVVTKRISKKLYILIPVILLFLLSAIAFKGLLLGKTAGNTIVPTEEEKLAIRGIKALKNKLKNPESLQIHEITCWSESGNLHIDLDVSAQNGFGGMNRGYYTVDENNGKSVPEFWDETNKVAVFQNPMQTSMMGDELDIKRIEKIMENTSQ